MIIGFLGKGGSGKSTLSHLFARHLASRGKSVLAIDSDHNMDLTYNLGVEEGSLPCFGKDGTAFLLENFGEGGMSFDSNVYSDLFRQEELPSFSLSPKDAFTERYSRQISDNLHVMSSGPHTDIVLHGNRCSHSLGTPLKVYLPLLELKENEAAVVDMIASSDAAATGIPTGFSFGVISVEPTVHSMKSAKQIMQHLEFFGVPHGYVINKSSDPEADARLVSEALGLDPIAMLPFDQALSRPDSAIPEAMKAGLSRIEDAVASCLAECGDNRKRLSIEKMRRNQAFKERLKAEQELLKKDCC